MSMSPGTYLQKRREAAGFSVPQAAAALAAMPERVRPLRVADFEMLEAHLVAVEGDDDALTSLQAALLRRIFHFDLGVYELLLLRHFCETPTDFPEPQICSGCAASWLDTCACPGAPAAAPGDSPTLCTVCRDRGPTTSVAALKGEQL